MNPREAARVEHLHQAFSRIAVRVFQGACIGSELSALARQRSRRFPRGKYSAGSIRNLYYAWKKAPTPLTLVRKYRGSKRQIPAALLLEFITRLTQSDVISAHAAFNSLRSDWRRGIPLPGIGAWRDSFGTKRSTPPPFPYGRSTFYDHLANHTGGRFRNLVRAAARGERDVRRFEEFVEIRREALEREIRHEAVANTLSATPAS
jgi:hypothetical protein